MASLVRKSDAAEPPAITNQSLTKQTTMLCFEGYATMHSGVSRTPIACMPSMVSARKKACASLNW
jgi:endonuclease G